jgi:hypothetical protein
MRLHIGLGWLPGLGSDRLAPVGWMTPAGVKNGPVKRDPVADPVGVARAWEGAIDGGPR